VAFGGVGIVENKDSMPSVYQVPENPAKTAKAQGSNLRVHFKNTHATAHAIRGMRLKQAQAFLQRVLDHKDAVPFRRAVGGVGRTAQSKQHEHLSGSLARWPKKSCQFVLDLLQNVTANAQLKDLNADLLHISHIQVNAAPKIRRRLYRAHGRVNPFMANPCHMEVVVTEVDAPVPKPSIIKKAEKGAARKAKRAAAAPQ
jgi:large subunit ribosomal protein L17e